MSSNAKPASKPASQSQSKKVEVQKVVVKSEGDDIKDAFELFDSNGTGKIDAREVRGAMQSIGFEIILILIQLVLNQLKE